ncbi:hypothetical protein DI392_11125 [Vibrio albus]|uniref:Lactonase family protein n=1 Tax=Vibrio albus TaxID=2200953 RepID=A0A2U3B9E8_9VIBR|nr:beta-propeller fold lactonase family protein [Vibrio albus]PWI33397.1 hypothetical protein DI392_11125 [Vibrio albus]
MVKETLVITYGDNKAQGRGLYRVSVDDGQLDAQYVYSCTEKPGAIIRYDSSNNGKDNKWLLSFRDEKTSSSGLRVLTSDDGDLVVDNDYSVPYFISSFSHLCPVTEQDHGKQMLGSSFHDGVDTLLLIDDVIRMTDVTPHTYRPRSDDIRQAACHPHHISQFSDEAWACSVDMGTDSVCLYSLQGGHLTMIDERAIDAPLGSGSRIMRLGNHSRFAYLLSEISNTVTVYSISREPDTKRPLFTATQCVPATLENAESSAAGCVITEDGQFLLVSNRGEDSIVLFSIDPDSGILTLCDRLYCAQTPRDLTLMGYQAIIAAQDAHCLQLIQIDAETRTLHLIDTVNGIPQPVGFVQ